MPVEIDPENFEAVMQRLGVALEVPGAFSIAFRELDDFHPDALYAKLPIFEPIQKLKNELNKDGVNKIGSNKEKALAQHSGNSEPPPPPESAVRPAIASTGSLLDQIASATAPPPPRVTAPSSLTSAPPTSARVSAGDEGAWDEAIRGIGSRHALPAEDPRQKEILATVDSTAAAQMRAILHHPEFQALEAAWRSVFFLMQQLETGTDLKIYLVDCSRRQFLSDPAALEKIFATPAVGDEPWSLIVGLFTFSPSGRDCAALTRFAKIAAAAGAPFLSGIDAKLFGCEAIEATPDPDDWKRPLLVEEAAAWRELRESPDADWIGLAMPRFLLRVPYGKKTSAIDAFEFEEMTEHPAHEDYLWGNAAVACACMIAQGGEPGLVNRIGGIPVHVYAPGCATPQAEIFMTERLAARIAEAGVMPLATVKNSDMVQLVRFQSITGQPLAGPW